MLTMDDIDYYCKAIADNAKKAMIDALIVSPYVKYAKEDNRNVEKNFLDIFQGVERKPKDVYTSDYLPFYMCDEQWLKKYIAGFYAQGTLNKYIDENAVARFQVDRKVLVNEYLNFNHIQKFVNNIYNDNLFQSKLEEYKNLLVYSQIKHMMYSTGPNAVDPEWNLNYFNGIKDYDKFFHARAVNVVCRLGIGMPIREVEKYVELNSNFWRRQVMEQAFENEYFPPKVCKFIAQKSSSWKEKLYEAKYEHLLLWVEKREADYYKDYIKGKPELEAIYLGVRSVPLQNITRLTHCEKKYQNMVGKYCQNTKKLSKLNYKPLSLYIGFRTREIIDNAKRRQVLNKMPSTSWGYHYAVGERKKIGLSAIFHHNDSEWLEYKARKLNEQAQAKQSHDEINYTK